VRDDERRLHELFLGRRLEELQLQYAEPIGGQHAGAEALQRTAQELHACEVRRREIRIVAMDRLRHRQPVERLAEIDRVALIGHRGAAGHLLRDAADQLLGQVHQVVVVAIRLVELEHRELGVVARRDAFVA